MPEQPDEMGGPPDLEQLHEQLEAATALLLHIPEYDWLTRSSKQWWKVAEVAENAGASPFTVRTWCDNGEIRGAVLYSAQAGWRLPRSGLLLHFAEEHGQKGSQRVG